MELPGQGKNYFFTEYENNRPYYYTSQQYGLSLSYPADIVFIILFVNSSIYITHSFALTGNRHSIILALKKSLAVIFDINKTQNTLHTVN
jgi:hypothetical protein